MEKGNIVVQNLVSENHLTHDGLLSSFLIWIEINTLSKILEHKKNFNTIIVIFIPASIISNFEILENCSKLA